MLYIPPTAANATRNLLYLIRLAPLLYLPLTAFYLSIRARYLLLRTVNSVASPFVTYHSYIYVQRFALLTARRCAGAVLIAFPSRFRA